MRSAILCALALVIGCAAPAFPVPEGPPKPIALDVRMPADVLGTWTVDSFSGTLREELHKYNIEVTPSRSGPGTVALVDLGRWTYRDWQEIDVMLVDGDQVTRVGRIRIPDLDMTTTDVAAQMVATLIAQRIWKMPARRL